MAMAAQGLTLSSIPKAIVLQTHSPVSQFKRTQSVGWGLTSRPQQLKSARCFWPLPFCPNLRSGDFWSGRWFSTTMDGSNSAANTTARAGSAPADRVDQRYTRQYNFETIVLEPKGEHLATVVWLHGFSDSGARSHPSAGKVRPGFVRPVGDGAEECGSVVSKYSLDHTNGSPRTERSSHSLYGQDVDMEGLDRSAETVAKLLLDEKTRGEIVPCVCTKELGGSFGDPQSFGNLAGGSRNVKLAVGGFSQGCATALYITACSVLGKYGGNRKPFPVKVDATIGLSGWMPTIQNLVSQMARNRDASERARTTSIFIGHCNDDGVVPARLAKASSDAFQGVGFNDITLKTYPNGGHSATSEEIADIREWITTKLGLEKSRGPSH